MIGETKVWIVYNQAQRFGQGSDHSDGIGLDSNTLVGFNFSTGELAYSYANNNIAPDISAREFAAIGKEYGNCIYAPEVNNKCGGIVITTLKELGYQRIFEQEDERKGIKVKTGKFGWEKV